MKIELWSDYACPYCYIGERRLEKAIEAIGAQDEIEIVMRSFELDPNTSRKVVSTTLERFAKKYGLSQEMAQRRIDDIANLGRAEGIDFKYSSTRYTNTFDAHRLTKFAESKGKKGISERLFEAYFTDNKELSSLELLKDIGVAVGLNGDEVIEMLKTDAFAEEVREDEKMAAAYGIHGVPYFLINGEYTVSGAQPVELLQRALQELLQKERIELLQDMKGEECGLDGCHIGIE